ncbi:hypothetical protein [Lutibacter sp.]
MRNTKIHNLSLRGNTGVLFGVISLLFIYLIAFFIAQFESGDVGVSMLPISFFELLLSVVSIVFVFISYLLIVLINKKKRKKLRLKKWDTNAKKIRLIYFLYVIILGVAIYFLETNGLLKLIVPVTIVGYGIFAIIAHKYTSGNTVILGIIFIIEGLVALMYPTLGFYLWGIAFGLNHIAYGIYYSNKTT